jgi:NAD+-dependent protein deacetylase SIR2
VDARKARCARPIRVGTLRPAIVLYDEPHPLGDDIGTIQSMDLCRKPDLLIVMGTSLKVHGLRKLVKEFSKVIHGDTSSSSATGSKTRAGKVIFVNKTAPSGEWADVIDYHVAGETDVWADKVLADWKKARPADWETQQTLEELSPKVIFRAVKNTAVSRDKKGTNCICTTSESHSCERTSGKKASSEHENIPPESTDMVLSTPDAVRTLASKPAKPPLSPSKRSANSSHYNDLESSPSKRRIAETIEPLEGHERKLLFTETTNIKASLTLDIFDLSMQDVQAGFADVSMRSLPPTPAKKVEPRPVRASARVAALKAR